MFRLPHAGFGHNNHMQGLTYPNLQLGQDPEAESALANNVPVYIRGGAFQGAARWHTMHWLAQQLPPVRTGSAAASRQCCKLLLYNKRLHALCVPAGNVPLGSYSSEEEGFR